MVGRRMNSQGSSLIADVRLDEYLAGYTPLPELVFPTLQLGLVLHA